MGIKKKNIANLIRAHVEGNDAAFRDESYNIACELSSDGDDMISEYIISLLSENTSLIPQINNFLPDYFRILPSSSDSLFLPDSILNDLIAVSRLIDESEESLNKFIFMGAPGTGKTESVRQLGRMTHREVISIDFSQLVDSKLGQTAKNIYRLFDDLNAIPNPNRAIIIFDEIDCIALDRINERDHREMGRATTEFLKGLDNLNKGIVIVATTNLGDKIDRALMRRFDMAVSFDKYTEKDLAEVAERILLSELKNQHKHIVGTEKTIKKFFEFLGRLPNPGELKNDIRVAVALSTQGDPASLFAEIIKRMSPDKTIKELDLVRAGFTIREMEKITGIPRSSLSRKIHGAAADA